MARLILFDIDGTLILTGGAGLRAMNRAGAALLGAADFLDGIQVAGRTDWIILHDAVSRLGRELDGALLDRLRERYIANLREEILRPGEGVKAVMPGIPELLTRLDALEDVYLGLLTGNFVEGARVKLEQFDLWRYFRCGAFGDDDPDRNALVPFAVDRAEACGYPRMRHEEVVVIGDTPHDVACARAVGAVPIAVATGNYSTDQLRAAGAAWVFEDLGDTEAVLRALGAGKGMAEAPGSRTQPARNAGSDRF